MDPSRPTLEEIAARQERLLAEVRELGFAIAELRRCAGAPDPAGMPPAAAAARSGSQAGPALPVPPPLPAQEPPPAAGSDRAREGGPAPRGTAEVEFGRVWLVRIGMVILLAGLVFLANYAWQTAVRHLGPAGKIALFALAGSGIAGFGFWLEKWRSEMAAYARALIAGGASALYYTVYAACYVPALRVVPGGLFAALAMLAAAGGLVLLADRRRSSTTAVLAIAFSYFTAAVQPAGAASLLGHVLLAAASAFLVLRHRWVHLAYVAIAAAFGSAAWWRLSMLFGPGFFGGALAADFWVAIPAIAGCWAIFTVCGWVYPAGTLSGPARAALITAGNAGAFAVTAFFVALAPGQDFTWWCGGFGLVLGALAALAYRDPEMPDAVREALFSQSMLLLAAAVAIGMSGTALALTLAVQATLIVISRARAGGRASVAVACMVGGAAAWYAVRDAANVPGAGWTTALPAALILFTGARVFSGVGRWAGSLAFSLLGVACGAATVFAVEYPGYQPSILAIAFAAATCAGRIHGIAALPAASVLWLLLAVWRCFVEPWDGLGVHGFGQNGIPIAAAAGVGAVRWGGWGQRPVASGLAAIAAGSYFLWVLGGVEPAWRPLALLLASAALLAAAALRGSRTLRWSALGLAACGYISSAVRADEASLPISLLALGVWLAVPPLARGLRGVAFGRMEAVLGFFGWFLAWVLCAAALPSSAPAFALTLTTGGVGAVALGAGVVARMRAWRWAGLLLAAGAVLKAVIADAWSLGTPARIISFLGLGAMLMAVGFLYNRYADRLRRWL